MARRVKFVTLQILASDVDGRSQAYRYADMRACKIKVCHCHVGSNENLEPASQTLHTQCSTYMNSFAFLSSGQHSLSCVALTANGGPMLLAESGIVSAVFLQIGGML